MVPAEHRSGEHYVRENGTFRQGMSSINGWSHSEEVKSLKFSQIENTAMSGYCAATPLSEILLQKCQDVGSQFFIVTEKMLVRRSTDCIDGQDIGATVIQYPCNGYSHQNWLYRNEVRWAHWFFFIYSLSISFVYRRKKSKMAMKLICVSVWAVVKPSRCKFAMALRDNNGFFPKCIWNSW